MDLSTTKAAGGRVAVEGDGSGAGIPTGDIATRRLPTGSHGIPPALVAQNQRERIIAATAEVSAEHGYCGTTVREVVARAGVSSSTFYQHFSDLEGCMIASFWELHARLMEQIDVACRSAADPAEKPRVALRRSLELFATDVPSARLLTVEIVGTGPNGARTQHEAIAQTAEGLGMSGTAGRGVIGMVTTLVAERVIAAEAQAIPELEAELDGVFRAYEQIR